MVVRPKMCRVFGGTGKGFRLPPRGNEELLKGLVGAVRQ